MIGNGYWSTGITVRWAYSGSGRYGWTAKVDYYDDGWAGDNDADLRYVSTEGTLRTRYAVVESGAEDALTVAIDVIKADAERLGIRWTDPFVAEGTACLYYADEESRSPEGWRAMLRRQAERIGWRTYERREDEAPDPREVLARQLEASDSLAGED